MEKKYVSKFDIMNEEIYVKDLENKASVELLGVTVENNTQSISNNTQSISNNTSLINNISTAVSKINKKKFLFIGDSYGTNNIFSTKNWIECCIENLGLVSGVNAFTSAMGGTGIASSVPNGLYGNIDFNGLIKYASSFDETLTDKNAITDIVIGGGCNDAYANVNSFEPKFAELKNTIKILYPNVTRVYVGFIGFVWDNYGMLTLLVEAEDRYKKECVKNGFINISNASNSLRSYLREGGELFNYQSTTLGFNFHPNNLGNKYISYYMTAGILGTKFEDKVFNVPCQLEFINGFQKVPVGGSPVFTTRSANSVKILVYEPFTIKHTGAMQVDFSGKWYPFCFIENCMLKPLLNYGPVMPVTFIYSSPGLPNRILPGLLKSEQGHLYFSIVSDDPPVGDFSLEVGRTQGFISRELA